MRLLTRFHWLPIAVILALAVFILNHTAVISGAWMPPEGYEPAWMLRNSDLPQNLTWLSAARDELLLRNYHAPWKTEPALFQPLFLLAARTGLPVFAAYYSLLLTLYVLAAWALLFAGRVFCPVRQLWWALAVSACTLPLQQVAWALTPGLPLKWRALFLPGLIDYGYSTADGFFRGGLSNSPTLTAGTACLLAAMALLARYLQTGVRRYLLLLCGTAFLSAFIHPFEIFVIVAASLVPLAVHRNIGAWILVGASGAAGMLPYVLTGAHAQWLRDSSESIHEFYHPVWILFSFGLPCFFLIQLLAMRFRMPDVSDWVLQSWFLSVPLLILLPGIPMPVHMLDGLAYCIGFLLVRRIASDAKLMRLPSTHPRAVRTAIAVVAIVSVITLSVQYSQLWRDGRESERALLVGAIRRVEERQLLQWIADHSDRSTLILSNAELAPWIATIPRPSLASHDFFGITFREQAKEVEQFIQGEPDSETVLEKYGVGIAVVAKDSSITTRLPPSSWRADIGPWKVYQFPGAAMSPYPGLKALRADAPRSMSRRLLEWLGTR